MRDAEHFSANIVPSGQFNTTHWSVVLLAGKSRDPQSSMALEKLCRTYWSPLFAFARRKGWTEEDAKDLTQQFFARLLARNYLGAVAREKGKFRSFLLAALEHFLANEWRRAQAQKRGGQFRFISLDDTSVEDQYRLAPASLDSPEQFFEQQWAITLLEHAVAKLRDEFTASGKGTFFEQFKIFLTGEKQAFSYAELAARMNTTEAAVKMAVRRMRQRYGELLRLEIANTVASPAEIDEELQALFAALSR